MRIFLLMLLLSTSLIAQRSIDGVVLEQSSEQPLMGVNVIKKNTNEGVTSDFDGKFTLNNVSPGDVYVISYVGFKSQEIIIENQNSLSILLEEDSALLDEIVVVGYGSQLKYDLANIKKYRRMRLCNPKYRGKRKST